MRIRKHDTLPTLRSGSKLVAPIGLCAVLLTGCMNDSNRVIASSILEPIEVEMEEVYTADLSEIIVNFDEDQFREAQTAQANVEEFLASIDWQQKTIQILQPNSETGQQEYTNFSYTDLGQLTVDQQAWLTETLVTANGLITNDDGNDPVYTFESVDDNGLPSEQPLIAAVVAFSADRVSSSNINHVNQAILSESLGLMNGPSFEELSLYQVEYFSDRAGELYGEHMVTSEADGVTVTTSIVPVDVLFDASDSSPNSSQTLTA